ncbi:MAG: phenylalanine--tRNA ligase subunit beta [Candidatus Altiarchaeota archaeon]
MPSVEYEFQDLVGLLGRDFSVQELEGWIPMIGVGLESIDERRIVLEVFPDRPDMLSIEGFARALKGFLGVEKGFVEYRLGDSDVVLYVDKSVKNVRPFCAGAVVRDVVLDDYSVKSLMSIQEKLHLTHGRNRVKVAIGVHDLDRVEPPFTYTAVDPDSVSFVPLDMTEELSLREILLEHPKGRDYAWTLDGASKYPLFVDKKGSVLSFPPIINGELTRLTEGSRNLFLELTGTSQLAVDQALNILLCSILDRGGKAYSIGLVEKK